MAQGKSKGKTKTKTIPESTPRTTAQIHAQTGRVSSGTRIDRTRYHQRPTFKEKEPELETQSIGGVIGTVGKTAVTA